METNLIESGILDEQADLRIHVGVMVRRLFVFEPYYAKQAIETGQFKLVPAYSFKDGIKFMSATGYLISPEKIRGCQEIVIPEKIWQDYKIFTHHDTSEKGRLATQIVIQALRSYVVPLPITILEVDNLREQNAGIDLVVSCKLQVKCDYYAGSKQNGGTGNLFIQVSETNPLKKY